MGWRSLLEARSLLVAGFVCLGGGACAHPPETALDRNTRIGAPLPRVDDISQVPVKGHSVEVIYGTSECSISGELIAVTQDSILVFDESGQLLSVPQSNLVEIYLALHPSSSGSIYTTTTIGSFSTVSHGLWLVVSLPIWLGIGLPLASHESRASHLQVDSSSSPRLCAYARFPQGALMDWRHRTSPVPPCG